jgi:hypothetical protein
MHDLEATQQHDGVENQTTNYRSPLMPSLEMYFVQQSDVPQQQNPNKYLRHKKISDGNVGIKGNKRKLRGISHHNISQVDSTIPIRKESHSSR